MPRPICTLACAPTRLGWTLGEDPRRITTILFFACASFLPIIVGCAVNTPSSGQQGQSNVARARAALSGTEQRLDFFYAVHPDCTSEGYPTIRTVTPPVHGKLRVEQATDYSNFPKDNQRYE